MKNIIAILIVLVYCELGSTGCKKDGLLNNSASSIVYLRNKPLSEIKSIIYGKWKIHYMYGGMTGRDKYELEDQYLRFFPNETEFERKETIYNYTAWFCKFSLLNGYENELVIDMKVKDTLVLVQNATDPFAYFMTKTE